MNLVAMSRACIAGSTSMLMGICLSICVRAEDWPMLGRDGSRNSVSQETGFPTNWAIESFELGRRIRESRGVLWSAPLGPSTFSSPVVSGGLVWIGTTQEKGDGSVLKCFRVSDGAEVYEYESPYLGKREHDAPWGGLGSSPLVEGDRLWLATNRSEVLCLDIGPLIRGSRKPRELWKLDFVKEFRTYPSVPLMGPPRPCSIGASWQDRLFVTINYGIGYGEEKVENPDAPSLVCLDKNTGAVIWKDSSPGENILSSQFSSPTLATIDGQVQVIVPQSDGWVRAFDPLDGHVLWEFDMNPKTSVFSLSELPGKVRRCCVLGNAVVYRDRVYVATGMDVESAVGPGRLVCIDPSRHGDISAELAVDHNNQQLPRRRRQAVNVELAENAIPNPNSGLVWEFTEAQSGDMDPFQRTLSSVAISQGLVIAADYHGVVHCFDASTGERHWCYDKFREIWLAPLIVDDKIYVADSAGDVAIFGLSADPVIALQSADGSRDPLRTISFGQSIYSSPIFADGVLFVARNDRLFAITGDREPAESQQMDGTSPKDATGHSRAEGGLLKRRPPNISSTRGTGRPRIGINRAPDAVFVPTPQDVVERMLKLAGVEERDIVYDLGSGDGRIVIAAARMYGVQAVGVEIDPELIKLSQRKVAESKLTDLVAIRHEDMFQVDLSQADVVAVFLYPRLLARLRPQFARMKPGSRIVSHQFLMPNIEPDQAITLESSESGDQHTLYLWTTPLKAPPQNSE